VWGFHPYCDVNSQHTTGTHQFLIDLSDQYWHFPKVWLTESGVNIAGNPGCAHPQSMVGDPNWQAGAGRTFTRLASTELKARRVPAHRGPWRPIRRVYYYEWKSDVTWPNPNGHFDSALLKGNSQQRPAYCVLARLSQSQCQPLDGL
jgi:hypothetical protein